MKWVVRLYIYIKFIDGRNYDDQTFKSTGINVQNISYCSIYLPKS